MDKRSLVGCSPWGRTESDTTEATWQQQQPVLEMGLITALGRSPEEGNGIPLQYSCMENPMDRGAW